MLKVSHFWTLLALMFIYLKLTAVVDWSWVVVLLPLWGPMAMLVFLTLLIALVNACDKVRLKT